MSDFVTLKQLMADLGVAKSSTIFRLISNGELPGFSIGSQASRVKAWHKSVLRMHAVNLYRAREHFVDISTCASKRRSSLIGTKNIGRPGKVSGYKMDIDLLGRSNRRMAK